MVRVLQAATVGIVPDCGQVLLCEPLSVRLGLVVASGDPSFYAGEVGGPLVELFGCLLQCDAELLPEGRRSAPPGRQPRTGSLAGRPAAGPGRLVWSGV